MAQINFPDNPSVNDTFTSGDRSWKWNGTTWTGIASTVPARYFTSTTPPTLAAVGDAWYNTETNRTYVYYDSYWVDTTSSILNAVDASATNSGIVNTGTQTFAGNKYFDGKVVGTTQPNGGSDGGVAVKAPISGTQTSAFLQFVNNAYTIQYASVEATPNGLLNLNASYVKIPSQPAFFAYRTSSVAAAQVWIADNAYLNTGGYYSTSTGRFTAPIAGRYVFAMNAIGSTSGTTRLLPRINGSTFLGGFQLRTINTTNYGDGHISWIFNLAAGDYVDIYLQEGTNYSDVSGYASWQGYLLG